MRDSLQNEMHLEQARNCNSNNNSSSSERLSISGGCRNGKAIESGTLHITRTDPSIHVHKICLLADRRTDGRTNEFKRNE